MSWPVGKVEQLLKIAELQRRLEEVQSGRRTVVLHSYYEPNRADWELSYQQQRVGTLPIPPGTKLCWYDMRSGWMRAYTTAWDRENGTATSGEIYLYSQPQNTDYFRFIGNIDVAGYLRGAENNTPNLHFGLDIGKRSQQRIAALEIFFQLNMPTGAVTNYLYLNYGNLVTQIDLSGVLYRQNAGGVGTQSSANSSTQGQLYREGDWDVRPTNPTYADSLIAGKAVILRPFGGLMSDGRPNGGGQTTVMVTMVTPVAAYVPSAVAVSPVNTGVAYRQFIGVSMRNITFDQYYRLFPTTSAVGADDALARKGHGWVYGYFEDPIGSLEEYP